MTLRWKMFFILAPVLAVIGYLGFYKMGVFQSRLDALVDNRVLVQEAETINALVHQVQRERGFSAGYIASSGAIFTDDLAEQRLATDAAIAALLEGTPATEMENPEAISDAKAAIDNLSTWRAEVDAFELTVPIMAGRYTGFIEHLLSASTAVTLSGDVEQFNNIDSLLQAKNT